jgi:glycosyltransferase involved in cell wall biosynthesis
MSQLSKYKNNTTVGVVVRTLGKRSFLQRALVDINRQNYNDLEIVVINDGGDARVVDEICTKIKLHKNISLKIIHHEHNKGMEYASNTALKYLKTKYVVIHDDDDTWNPDWMEKAVNYLENSESYGVMCWVEKVVEKEKGGSLEEIRREPYTYDVYGLPIAELMMRNIIATHGFVYRREVLDEIGYYDESLKVIGDWEFNLRFISKYDIHVIPEYLCYYHIRHEGPWKNSVVNDATQHKINDAVVRNRLFRSELISDRMAILAQMSYLEFNNYNLLVRNKSIIRSIFEKIKKIWEK